MNNRFPSTYNLPAKLSRLLAISSLLLVSHAAFAQSNFEEDFDDEAATTDDEEFPTEDDLATEDYIEDDDLYFEDEY